MRFDIITIVWGERHVGLFLELTLPNVLSAGNLPALARDHEVTYRFFTTAQSRTRIEGSLVFEKLKRTCAVEFLVPLGERTPDVSWHVHWFHRSAAEGKVRGAAVVFVPPDTLWTDGALAAIGGHIAAGKKGVACPFVLVVAETLVPEAKDRFGDGATGVITVPRAYMWPLIRRHVHPLHALAVPGSPHGRPAFELHWPVGTDGMISRYAVRELVAFDPRRCPISFLWYAAGPEDLDGIHFVTDSDEMLMLSVDPLPKYFQNYIVGHSCDGFDLARTTRHPLNDTHQTRVFAPRSVAIHGAGPAAPKWHREEARAKATAREIRVGRAAMLLHDELSAHGASLMSGLLSVGLLDTHFVRRWRHEPPLTVVVPADAAFDAVRRATTLELGAAGRDRDLVDLLHDHVAPGRLSSSGAGTTLNGVALSLGRHSTTPHLNGARILHGPVDLEGIELYVIDRQLSPRLAVDPPALAAPSLGDRLGALWRSVVGGGRSG